MTTVQPQTRLTMIELRVLQRLAQGYTCRQIAAFFGYTNEEGVRSALERARRRLEADTTVQAVAIAVTRGLVNVRLEASDDRG